MKPVNNSGSPPIQSPLLERELQAYSEWKHTLTRIIEEYRVWVRRHGLSSDEDEQRIDACQRALDSDRLTIAFVSGFSRGKTELINAMFFASYGRRLLPSTAGCTTMCPTELFYDQKAEQPAYIKLLPVETRLQRTTSLDQLKQNPASWVTCTLDPSSADQVANCFQQVTQTRRVRLEEAELLGLYDPEQEPSRKGQPATIEIPKWRHALISLPHPLLKQGLTIIDTPGLSGLGHEPEIPLNMLSSAQAILFVLAADTGVTRSDMALWQNWIEGSMHARRRGLMVILNKMDMLWDELQDDTAISASIEKQCDDAAAILDLPRGNIFPVSARKGLLSKIQGDKELLQECGLLRLEKHLFREIQASCREAIQNTITVEISHMLEGTIGGVASRHQGILAQLSSLQELSGKSAEVIEHLIQKNQREEADYIQEIHSFQAGHQAQEPPTLQVREQREQMRSRLQKLEKISSSRNTLETRITELQQQDRATRQQLSTLRSISTALHQQIQQPTGNSAS